MVCLEMRKEERCESDTVVHIYGRLYVRNCAGGAMVRGHQSSRGLDYPRMQSVHLATPVLCVTRCWRTQDCPPNRRNNV